MGNDGTQLGLFSYFRFQNLNESWDSRFKCFHFTTCRPLKIPISSCLYLYQIFFCLVAILQDTKQSVIWQLANLRNLTTVHNIYTLQNYHNTLSWCCIDNKNTLFCKSFLLLNLRTAKYFNFGCHIFKNNLINKWNDYFQHYRYIGNKYHTIECSENFKSRNFNFDIEIYFNSD